MHCHLRGYMSANLPDKDGIACIDYMLFRIPSAILDASENKV